MTIGIISSDVTPCKLCAVGKVSIRYSFPKYDLLECQACGFRFIPYLDQIGLAGALPGEGEIEAEIKYARTGLESNGDRLNRLFTFLRRAVPIGGKVLDVGCGAGAFLALSKSHYAVWGVELSPVRRTICARRGFDVSGDALENDSWDADAGKFDAVTLWDVIEHVNDPVALTNRIRMLLKPGGVLLLDTPTRDGFLYRFGALTALLTAGRYPTTMGIQYSPTPFAHKQIFRRKDMRAMLRAVGYEDVTITQIFEMSFPLRYYAEKLAGKGLAANLIAFLANAVFRLTSPKNKMIVTARRPLAG